MTGVDRDRAAIRIAAADIALGRHREGRDALRPYLSGALADEASFHFATATRGLKMHAEHIALSRAFVEKFPTSPFAEEILNSLASAYIIDDRDDEAEQVFREVLMRYPAGRFAERAAWKTGWSAYRRGQFLDALQYFDKGAAQFPRSDYRPSWLYWSGRAAQQGGDVETGIARLAAATNRNNRIRRLDGRPFRRSGPPRLPDAAALTATRDHQGGAHPSCCRAQSRGDDELHTRNACGDSRHGRPRSPQHRGGNSGRHQRMKRAYPQYLAAAAKMARKACR